MRTPLPGVEPTFRERSIAGVGPDTSGTVPRNVAPPPRPHRRYRRDRRKVGGAATLTTVRVYTRRADAFEQHAGEGLL